MSIKLPIVIGQRYVCRDGEVVTAQHAHEKYNTTHLVHIGQGTAEYQNDLHVFTETGRISAIDEREYDHKRDLVADYIEPAAIDAEVPKGHPHALSMLLYAQDAAIHAEPWKLWEFRSQECSGEWTPLSQVVAWTPECEYRHKPRTVRIGEFDVPEPLRVVPAVGTLYFSPAVSAVERVQSDDWTGDEIDHARMKNGVVHLTWEAADKHARALIALTAVKS